MDMLSVNAIRMLLRITVVSGVNLLTLKTSGIIKRPLVDFSTSIKMV